MSSPTEKKEEEVKQIQPPAAKRTHHDDNGNNGKKTNNLKDSSNATTSSSSVLDPTTSDYEAIFRSVMKDSATVTENLQAIYEKYCSIVGGPPEADGDGNLVCANCGGKYKESENNNSKCMWYADSHMGICLADENSDAWYGWHEANPPMQSAYWKKDGGNGGHKWTGCGCTDTRDECERIDRHKPEGYPPSPDDWVEEESAELSDDEFDVDHSRESGQDLLISNYILGLNYIIKRKMKNSQ
mmetsp:Transcript_11994/g.17473  ORF Transcript_11994/g.17473 Transcript_11994/m.17473 type:complete len:242 (+) Transcript_11994:142-867(+)|eukprot:14052050-Ditylum_brightwellii.AAC.1